MKHEEDIPNLPYRVFVLGMVTAGFALNFLDRQILSILLQPIKQDLHLSDTSLGFLSGLAFALFYATLGIPVSRMADRGSRRLIMSVSMALWSLATTTCGLAHSFWQLFMSRVGVGIGEAGFTPAGLALVSDYFPRSQRGLATGVVNTGPMFGTMLGLLIGGWVAGSHGWRLAFSVCGLPGVFFSLIFWLSVRDPAIRAITRHTSQPEVRGSFAQLWEIRAYRFVLVGSALSAFGLYGISLWMPSFLARSHGMPLREIGSLLGPLTGIVGGVGMLLGGWLTDVLARRRETAVYWIPAAASILSIPPLCAALLLKDRHAALLAYGLAYMLGVLWVAPTFVAIQSLVPDSIRVTALAWKLFMTSLVGLGLGPQAIGVLSDWLAPSYGVESLRVAMLSSTVILVVPTLCYWAAARADRSTARITPPPSG